MFECFHTMVQTQFQSKIRVLRSDNGREHYNSAPGSFFQQHGIIHQTSYVDTPQKNGFVERKNKHLLEVTQSLMLATNVPNQFLGYAFLTAIYLINRIPSWILNFHTPYSTLQTLYLTNCILTYIPLKIFGCTTFVYNLDPQRSKLDTKSIKSYSSDTLLTKRDTNFIHLKTKNSTTPWM